ncbi:MAG: TonB-dependent receptor [Tannerella sp.]|jgi:TonB-linked SusC/RagA family outer membrane protein|nr:TonB-dependent receptor [Tannerella sp.]
MVGISNNFLLLRKQMLAIAFVLLASAGLVQAGSATNLSEGTDMSVMSPQQAKLTVKGVVSDELGTIAGATVVEKGTTNGTVTDMDGGFSLNVASDAILVVSFLGYQEQEIPLNGRTSVEVLLLEDLQALEEVVVVGYGVQKKVNLTGAVSSIGSEKITSRPAMNLSSSLAGLAPGVRVTQGRGNPGDENVSINIRGLASINASSPMILVDGVVADMSVVNPDDVESISILKDAASAAIYGSRAANGVVLVTTKKGKTGKPTVNFSAMFAQEKAVTSMKFLSSTADWMTAHNTAANNNTPGGTLPYEQTTIDEWRAADANPNGLYVNPYNGNTIPNWLAYPNTDWAQEMFQPSFYHRYSFSVSGGNDQSKYLLSASYQDNPGALENTGMQRFNIRANVETKINNFITIGTQTWATKEYKEPGSTSMTYLLQAFPGIYPKYNGYYGTSEDPNMTVANNVLHSIASNGGEREYTRINTTWFANVDIWKGLSFETKFNYSEYQRQDATNSQYMPRYRFREGTDIPITDIGTLDQATTSRYSYYSSNYTADLILRYMASFGDHDISAFVAYEQYYAKTSGFRLTAQGLLDWNVTDINSAAEMLNWGTDTEKSDAAKTELGMLSYFGRVNYAYKGKYLFEVNLRSDGSSRFAPDNRWGTFPSFSLGWRVSEEGFFTPVKEIVSNLKLKASYGTLGNQVSGYYDWQSLYEKKNNVFNESIQNGVVQSQLPNFSLSWEKTSTLNVGFESTFLKNRLGLDFDVFTRHTTDMLVNPPQYLTIGNVKSPKSNLAEMKNSGIDIALSWQDRIGDFSYRIGVNAGYNTNEVTKYKGALVYEADAATLDIWGNPTWRYTNLADVTTVDDDGHRRIAEGHMVNEYFIRKPYKGSATYMNADGTVNPNGGPKDGMIRTKADLDWVRAMIAEGYSFNNKTIGTGAANIWYGDMIFADANGDGKYGNDDDREFTGKSQMPKWVFGLNLSAEWKGIDLGMTWSGRIGSYHYIYERGANANVLTNTGDAFPAKTSTMFYSYNADAAKNDPNYDPATDPNANYTAKYPRLLNASSTMVSNTYYLYNTSYLSLKNLQIGYTLPKRWLAPAKLSNVRVFMTGENLLTIKSKDFPAVDPELGAGVIIYPIARSISGGISVTF